MSEVEPNFQERADCGCGCGKFGVLNAWGCVKRVCGCKRCQGRKNRRNGLAAQTKGAKALGVPRVGAMRPGDEEHYAGALRMESKSGGIVKACITAYRHAEAQSEAARPIGDHRPYVGVFTHDGLTIFACRADKALEVAVAILANHGIEVGA